MTEDPQRPDPDALIRRLQADEAQRQRARLKIFFGFAPGVGKTYRMLQVARELRARSGDVLVGAVETHGRRDTQALLDGLPVLPRREIDYRGRILDEFDLDAALARKPKVLILDELAHTNAPGSRHTKRWQDVLELLDAGIDVFTALNVQHVESLNDVVAQITQVVVRETVPDSVLDRADEIELVDLAPEALLARLEEGKVYLPDQAARAARNFFQRGNLLALRELALRRTAERVDQQVEAWRDQQGLSGTWRATERIAVCVGPSPASGRLVRAAGRAAAANHAPWVALTVETTGVGPLREADRERLEAHLRLAESQGARIVRLSGPTVGAAVLDYCQKHHVTRIVVGKPTHSRLWDRLTGSLLDEIVRGSEEIDVQVIAGDPGAGPAVGGQPEPAEALPWASYAGATVVVALATALGQALVAFYPIPDAEMVYLAVVMLVAVRLGRGPALWAAALSVGAYDFFFVEPAGTLAVADARYILTFVMMFAVGGLLSALAGRLKHQEEAAVGREERTRALYALVRDLGSVDGAQEIAKIARQHAAEAFGTEVVVLIAKDGQLVGGEALETDALGVARWVFEHDQVAGAGTDTLPGASVLCAPLNAQGAVEGVLALFRANRPMGAEQRELLGTFCTQVGLALERAHLADQAAAAAFKARTEEMRSSLLSAVSHDLRTPLATITGASTTLRDQTATLTEAERDELAQSIASEAWRLERLVANLLDMIRLESGAMAPRREWVPVDEVLGSALQRVDERLGERKVTVSIGPDVPLIAVDPVLFEQVFVNLLENAAKYTPAGSALTLSARFEGEAVVIDLDDQGPGVPAGEEERIFEKFHRGSPDVARGAGLGLAIVRGIVGSHGGTVVAMGRPGGGARFRVRLPATEPAPTVDLGAEAPELP